MRTLRHTILTDLNTAPHNDQGGPAVRALVASAAQGRFTRWNVLGKPADREALLSLLFEGVRTGDLQ